MEYAASSGTRLRLSAAGAAVGHRLVRRGRGPLRDTRAGSEAALGLCGRARHAGASGPSRQGVRGRLVAHARTAPHLPVYARPASRWRSSAFRASDCVAAITFGSGRGRRGSAARLRRRKASRVIRYASICFSLITGRREVPVLLRDWPPGRSETEKPNREDMTSTFLQGRDRGTA